ncbi:hypothetical protein [Maridesulfovibrio sp.]|uniref:hypothetical protein n=1 Tax=Maridesulfovibrio sp. TaxID=2795000 RepID=UPI002A18E088|nr:hypothetical protein [Maridesulfovibrio sp.]
MENLKRVTIAEGIPGTITLLQRGVVIRAVAGMSIREFMEEALGLSSDYAETRVRTIFLNASPVDDIDGVKIQDGDYVSLSGALPGICGIAMGRDTVISPFRSEISAKSSDMLREGEALIYLKLFNLIAKEAGPGLLRRGVLAEADDIICALGENAPQGLAETDGTVHLQI